MASYTTAPIYLQGLELRPTGEVLVLGDRVALSRREFGVLWLLATQHDQLVTREAIYEQLWGGEMPYRDRNVDVTIRKLRSKLAAAAPTWIFIHTHYGWGYRLDPDSSPREAGD